MQSATLFWKVANGDHPCPHASSLLGWEFIFYEPEKRQVRVRFHASASLTTPLQCIHGGMLGAMLDDCMSAAVLAALGPEEVALSTRLETRLLAPALPGHLAGVARVTRRTGKLHYTSGELHAEDGTLLATGKACYKVIPLPPGGVLHGVAEQG